MHPLLITNLWNHTTPFIRYQNGDSVLLGDGCPCGQQFPLIKSINGRTMDILKLDNGKMIAGPALTLIFRDMDIIGWQVIQRSPQRLEVRVCTRDDFKEEYAAHIKRVMGFHIGEDIKLEINPVAELEHATSGKLKPIWVEFDGKE